MSEITLCVSNAAVQPDRMEELGRVENRELNYLIFSKRKKKKIHVHDCFLPAKLLVVYVLNLAGRCFFPRVGGGWRLLVQKMVTKTLG